MTNRWFGLLACPTFGGACGSGGVPAGQSSGGGFGGPPGQLPLFAEDSGVWSWGPPPAKVALYGIWSLQPITAAITACAVPCAVGGEKTQSACFGLLSGAGATVPRPFGQVMLCTFCVNVNSACCCAPPLSVANWRSSWVPSWVA